MTKHVATLVLAFALVGLGTTPPAAGGEIGLERGLRYESSPEDEQQVGFWVVGERRDGETLLAFHVDVRCVQRPKLFGAGTFTARVDEEGHIRAEGGAFNSEANDGPVTSGEVTVEGSVQANGTAEGTVSVEFSQTNEQDEDDVYARCEVDDERWHAAGVPDPSIARVTGFTELPRRLRDLDATAADEQALYALHSEGRHGAEIVRIDPTTGSVDWSIDVEGGGSPGVVVGTGAVWVTDYEGGEPQIRGFAADDGQPIATVPGFAVAIGPAGEVWIATDDEVRRVDPATGDVVATVSLPGEFLSPLAAGPQGLYVGLRVVNANAPIGTDDTEITPLARVDPTTGAVLARWGSEDLFDEFLVFPDAASIWIRGIDDGFKRLDASTLEVLATSKRHRIQGRSSALASSRLWLTGNGTLDAYGPSGAVEVTIPWVDGALSAAGSTVWLLDPTLGLIRVDAS